MDHRVSQLRLLHDLLDLLQLLVIGPPHRGSDCRRDAGLSRISCDTGEAERERERERARQSLLMPTLMKCGEQRSGTQCLSRVVDVF